MPSVVFTSYAQADREPYLTKFVDEFRRTLGGYQGIPDDEERKKLAFFDRDIEAGEKWSDAILKALNEAQVLVCMISHTYLRRPWCGRELQFFLDRSDSLNVPGAAKRFILPVWWQKPTKPRPLPARLEELNWRDPKFPKKYPEGGIWGLYRKERRKDFRTMADRLAELVYDALNEPNQLPPGNAVADVEEIHNAFDEQEDFDVRLLALTTNGDDWQPTPNDVTVAKAAEEVAEKLQVFIRPVDQALGLSAGLEKAQNEHQIILLVVDASGGPNPILQQIDALNLPNLAVLLVEPKPAGGADGWLKSVGPAGPSAQAQTSADTWLQSVGLPGGALAQAKANGFFRMAGPGGLIAEMQMLLNEATSRLATTSPPTKAEDADLANKVWTESGIDLQAQPQLSGPGGAQPR